MRKVTLVVFLGLFFVGYLGAQEKLTEEQAQAQIQELRNREATLKKEIESLRAKIDKLNRDKEALERRVNALSDEIEQLKAEIAKYPSEYTVQEGDCLWKIAAKRYIYNRASAWPRIYRANLDLIKDPNLIYPDWVLKIPHGLDKTYTVIPGDYLWKIAGFYWIYNNPREWPRIYEANRDKIKDPDLIYPGQVLDIPRD
jgi:nucleoid-associated protein YgaU